MQEFIKGGGGGGSPASKVAQVPKKLMSGGGGGGTPTLFSGAPSTSKVGTVRLPHRQVKKREKKGGGCVQKGGGVLTSLSDKGGFEPQPPPLRTCLKAAISSHFW